MEGKFSLREFGKHLREIMACPACGKSRMVHATAWKGHGTGRRGETAYDATAFEGVTVETHCTCPGGPARHLLGQAETK